MEKKYNNYIAADEKILEGFIVAKVGIGINTEDSGMYMELERTIDNVTIGIDLIYDPKHEEQETPLMISNEYVKIIID